MRGPEPLMRWLAPLLLLVMLSGCGKVGYYLHLAEGQWQLSAARTPIGKVIAAPETPAGLAAALRDVRDVRAFAIDTLALPDNGSYTHYVDLHRDYVVWNVMAAPAYSLEARETCHWFVGCLAYWATSRRRAPRPKWRTSAPKAETPWSRRCPPIRRSANFVTPCSTPCCAAVWPHCWAP